MVNLRYDIVIIGAGPAGMMAAISAKNHTPHAQVCIIEKQTRIGHRLLVTGGGRCNITNTNVSTKDYVSSDLAKMQSILNLFSQEKTVEWFSAFGLQLKTENDGKLFPTTDRAQSVLDCLINGLDACNVAIYRNTCIKSIKQSDKYWELKTESQTFRASKVIIATGGCACPGLGSDGLLAQQVAHDFNLKHIDLCYALSPISLQKQGPFAQFAILSGITTNVGLSLYEETSKKLIANTVGSLLFTHNGISGPAALNMSTHLAGTFRDNIPTELFLEHPNIASYKQAHGLTITQARNFPTTTTRRFLSKFWPERMAQCLSTNVDEKRRLCDLNKDQLKNLAQMLYQCKLFPNKSFSWDKCEVSSGGIVLSQLHPKTLQYAKSGLFFCGEVLDVTGNIGGYNLQWAWSSGWVAGRGAASTLT